MFIGVYGGTVTFHSVDGSCCYVPVMMVSQSLLRPVGYMTSGQHTSYHTGTCVVDRLTLTVAVCRFQSSVFSFLPRDAMESAVMPQYVVNLFVRL